MLIIIILFLQALSKIRKSLRDKKSSSTAGLPSSAGYEPSAGTGNTPSPLGKVSSTYLVRDTKSPNNQFCFPQFLTFEKENKLFISCKTDKNLF